MTLNLDNDNAATIHDMGYREFIGGNDTFWNAVGDLQFRYLVEAGLQPHHTFVDVACGSLRGGCRFIPYLHKGNYLGLEQHIELVIYGVGRELGFETFRDKQPSFVISSSFEFERFRKAPDYGLAQSLFSHLNAGDILTCLRNLKRIAAPTMRFFATFHESESQYVNPDQSGSLVYFAYTAAEMIDMGREAGWSGTYIGDWKHPREQKLVEFRPAV